MSVFAKILRYPKVTSRLNRRLHCVVTSFRGEGSVAREKTVRDDNFEGDGKETRGEANFPEKNILRSNFPDLNIPNEPLWHYVFHHTYKWPNKRAMECASTGKKLTFDQIRRQTRHFNRFLRKRLKLKTGDVVAIMLPNVPEYPVALLGTLQAGLIPTTVNPFYTEDEVFRQLKQTSVTAIVTLDTFIPLVKKACSSIAKEITIIAVASQKNQSLDEGIVSFDQSVARECDIDDLKPNEFQEIGAYLYSSGTTGLPKAVVLTTKNLVSGVHQATSENFRFLEQTSAEHQDVIPAVLPFYHVYGIISMLWMLHFGCKIVTIPKFTPEVYLDTLKTYKPNVLLAVPPIVHFLTANEQVKPEHLDSLRVILSGAAPLGALDEQKFLEKITPNKATFLQGYGLSETGILTIAATTRPKVGGSCGHLVPNTVAKIVGVDDPSETGLGPNQTGELYVKGPQVFKGYLNNYEANENAFSREWFKTGDIAYYTEDGSFFITDRIKDMIKVNAFPVAPAELEEIIRSYEGVLDAAVIGVPSEMYGEVPRAYVVPKPGKDIDGDKLYKFVEEQVAPYKKIRGGIVLVETLEKTASGKTLKKVMREEYLKLKK